MSRPPTAWRGNGSSRCSTSWSRSCRRCDGRWMPGDRDLRGPVARRMAAAVRPFAADRFITPMAAVAGAVADEICEHMVTGGGVRTRLRERRRRHRAVPDPGRDARRGPGARPRPSRPGGQDHRPGGRRRPRGRDQRTAWPELLARHRRRGDRAGRVGRPRRRRGHADRQRRRPAGSPSDPPGARARPRPRFRSRGAAGHDRGRRAHPCGGRARARVRHRGSRADAAPTASSPRRCCASMVRSRRSRRPC